MIFGEIPRRTEPIPRATAAFAGVSVVAGGAIGVGLYATGTVGLQALAERLALSLKSRGEIAQLIGKEQTKLIGELVGGGRAGALKALAKTTVPEGLTTESLVIYREVARRAIVLGIDKLGVQAIRKQIVEKVLLQRGVVLF